MSPAGVGPSSMLHNGTPYQYVAEAEAGVYLQGGGRWWGTRVKYRPGTRGAWRSLLLVGTHPMDAEGVVRGLTAWLVQGEKRPRTPARRSSA